jgi:type IV secretion system protein VirB10
MSEVEHATIPVAASASIQDKGGEDTHDATASPAKGDPGAFALRARPADAIRFKRGAIVAISAAGTVCLVAVAWFALGTSALHFVSVPDERSEPARPPSDSINALPSSYEAVPKLGPPLPGDLGRPILDHQRSLADMGMPGGPMGGAQGTSQGPIGYAEQARAQAVAQERARQADELRAALQSGLLVSSQGQSHSVASSAGSDKVQEWAKTQADASSSSSPATAGSSPLSLDPDRDPNAQARKAQFVTGQDRDNPVNAHVMRPPASPNLLSAGSVIAASLITGVRSDVPGLVIAQVTEQVFDSVTGTILLIPQGSRLVGTYDSVVAFGQTRALVVWQRIIMPDGSSLQLDNVPATDTSGYAGLSDKVDFHTWQLLKGVAISTMLGVGGNLTFSGESDLVQAIREATQQNVARAGDQLTSRNLAVQPTISVRPGAPVRLVVHRDLILKPWSS